MMHLNDWLQTAVKRYRAGDFAGVFDACDQAERLSPGNVEVGHLRAMALGKTGHLDRAASLFEDVAGRHPQRHAVLGNLGNALRAGGRQEEAVSAFERAVAAAPEFVTGWVGLGLARKDAGDLTGAQTALEHALRLKPDHAGAANNLGVLLTRMDRNKEAVSAFDRALSVNPNLVSALVNRGAALRGDGDSDGALADHRAAVRASPDLAEAHYQLANSLRQSGDRVAAEASYRQALSLEPAREDIHSDLVRMLWEYGDADRFLAPLADAAKRLQAPALYVLLGGFALRAGDVETARHAAGQAITIADQLAPAWRLLANTENAAGDLSAARAHGAKATALAPDDFDTLHDFAETLLAAGAYNEAAGRLDRNPPDAFAQRHLGLQALAMRAAGDPAYRRFYDFDRFTSKIRITPPQGFSSIEAFNAEMISALRPLHPNTQQPIDQTLFGGTQSLGSLWRRPEPIFRALKEAMLSAAAAFVDSLPTDETHPFLRQKTDNLRCAGSWSVMLASGGGHVDHIHPKGWISAVYYAHVPAEISDSTNDRAGFLRLGSSGVRGLTLPAEAWVRPEPGTVVFFPSCMWHGVEPFESYEQRVTAPFDLAPALRSH
ncbi:MAG: tetratricopeptide repeat protein [Pseudomonadota bacterium]